MKITQQPCPTVPCATCKHGLVSRSAAVKGVKRCAACIEAGIVLKASKARKGGGPGWRAQPIASVSKRHAEPPPAESWWTTPMPREQFMAIASARHPGLTPPEMALSRSPSGRMD